MHSFSGEVDEGAVAERLCELGVKAVGVSRQGLPASLAAWLWLDLYCRDCGRRLDQFNVVVAEGELIHGTVIERPSASISIGPTGDRINGAPCVLASGLGPPAPSAGTQWSIWG